MSEISVCPRSSVPWERCRTLVGTTNRICPATSVVYTLNFVFFSLYFIRFPAHFNSEFPSQALNLQKVHNSVIKRAVTFRRRFPLREKFVSCAQLSDRVWSQPGPCPVCTSVSSSKEKRPERETEHSPPFCPRLITNWVTYCHFHYMKSGSSIPAGQIHLLPFTYEFYLTLVGTLGQGIGHLQPSYNREDKADVQSKPYFFFLFLCDCERKGIYLEIWALLGFYVV
jgi:hypothetical protein